MHRKNLIRTHTHKKSLPQIWRSCRQSQRHLIPLVEAKETPAQPAPDRWAQSLNGSCVGMGICYPLARPSCSQPILGIDNPIIRRLLFY